MKATQTGEFKYYIHVQNKAIERQCKIHLCFVSCGCDQKMWKKHLIDKGLTWLILKGLVHNWMEIKAAGTWSRTKHHSVVKRAIINACILEHTLQCILTWLPLAWASNIHNNQTIGNSPSAVYRSPHAPWILTILEPLYGVAGSTILSNKHSSWLLTWMVFFCGTCQGP